jgi:hypothetical protein
MKKIFIFLSIILCVSCSNKKTIKYIEVETLSASNIYVADSVYNYQNVYGDKNKDIASAYKKRADEVEKTNIEKSVYFAKRAVTLNPSLENYLFLADKIEKKEDYNELCNLYWLLIYKNIKKLNTNDYDYLFSKPNEEIVYKTMIAELNSNKRLEPDFSHSIEELGYDKNVFKEKLKNDNKIKMDKKSSEFQLAMLQLCGYDELEQYAKQQDVFKDFLNNIPENKMDISINENDIAEFNYHKDGLYEDDMYIYPSALYQYYLPEKQLKPNHWFIFDFISKFYITPTIVALEYAIDTSATACPKEMRHIYRKIATYDTKSVKLIDSKIFAYQAGEESATSTLKGTSYTVTYYKRKFKKKYSKFDFDNELIGSEKIEEKYFSITTEGKINPVD